MNVTKIQKLYIYCMPSDTTKYKAKQNHILVLIFISRGLWPDQIELIGSAESAALWRNHSLFG